MLYPTTHAVVGIMDMYSLQNIEDLRLNFSIKPTKKFTASNITAECGWPHPPMRSTPANQAPRTGGTAGAAEWLH